jgi:hypothetical protein
LAVTLADDGAVAENVQEDFMFLRDILKDRHPRQVLAAGIGFVCECRLDFGGAGGEYRVYHFPYNVVFVLKVQIKCAVSHIGAVGDRLQSDLHIPPFYQQFRRRL